MPVNASKAHEQWERFVYCRDRGHLEFITKADKCDAFFRGQQWEDADIQALRAQLRPAITINKVISTVGTILGEQIYNRTEVLFRPSNGSPAELADALSKVWMQISQNNQLPWVRSDVFCDGIVRSRGFYDARIDFADSMMGEVRITILNPKNVIIDPDAEEYDPDHWNDVFVTKWMTGQDIETLYNRADALYLASKEGSVWPYGYDSIERLRDTFGGYPNVNFHLADDGMIRRNIRVLERQYRKLDNALHFVDIETGDMRLVPSDWDRDRVAMFLEKVGGRLATLKKKVKRIRWCVTADDVVLHDEWSPYKHFTIVPYFPYFRYGNTVGIVENLLGPQEILNKVSSQELHIVNTTANSGWVLEEDSLANMTIEELETRGAQTGLVIEYRKGTVNPPTKITPNQTPTGLDRISYKAEEHIKTISNVSDSMQGFDREDVAAKAIAYKQQRGAVNLTKVLDNLERTDWLLARNCLDLIQAYYTEYRILNITHDDPTRQSDVIEINAVDPATGQIINDLTIGEYDIVVTSSPHRASLEDSQFEQARALREIGVQIPDSVLIENSRLLRRSEIIKQIEGDKESPEAQRQAQMAARMQEAEVADKEADVLLKQSKARAEQQNDGAIDLQKMMAELQLDREKMAAELDKMKQEMMLKVAEMEQKIALKREEHMQDMALKQQEAEQNARIREEDAEARRIADFERSMQSENDTENATERS